MRHPFPGSVRINKPATFICATFFTFLGIANTHCLSSCPIHHRLHVGVDVECSPLYKAPRERPCDQFFAVPRTGTVKARPLTPFFFMTIIIIVRVMMSRKPNYLHRHNLAYGILALNLKPVLPPSLAKAGSNTTASIGERSPSFLSSDPAFHGALCV
ncbi:hypothetical protein BDV59DRAFT_187703, partial [Aspergillus ambiguus]|uniref:uncharacterized protein n=1 Tax=Aspergillus ambiguus TaxID=176160 RepID=UPI003CCE1470